MKARYAPVYWEPMPSVGERFVSIIVVQPLSSESEVLPSARVVLPIEKLRAMFGRSARQIFGLMNETAALLGKLLENGVAIEALQIPFNGFVLGEVRYARGRTIEQMLDSAVRSVSALGAAENFYDPPSMTIRRQTQATSSFIQKVRKEFSSGDFDRKQRFRRTIVTHEKKIKVTVDYAFQRWMVQMASLPQVRQQDTILRNEAEAKLFELNILKQEFNENAKPVLLINATALRSPASKEAQRLAEEAADHFTQLASVTKAELIQVKSPLEATHVLERMT